MCNVCLSLASQSVGHHTIRNQLDFVLSYFCSLPIVWTVNLTYENVRLRVCARRAYLCVSSFSEQQSREEFRDANKTTINEQTDGILSSSVISWYFFFMRLFRCFFLSLVSIEYSFGVIVLPSLVSPLFVVIIIFSWPEPENSTHTHARERRKTCDGNEKGTKEKTHTHEKPGIDPWMNEYISYEKLLLLLFSCRHMFRFSYLTFRHDSKPNDHEANTVHTNRIFRNKKMPFEELAIDDASTIETTNNVPHVWF